MFTQEQLIARKEYIGASEAAAVLGLSRWSTPLRVWGEKTGQIEPAEETLPMWVGTEMEEIVAKKFTKDTGKKVHRVNEAFTHKKYSFLRCHIDRKVEGERAILQCKTASAYKAEEWADGKVPKEYIIQELHELSCSGYDRAYIAVLIGNHDFKMVIVERDEKLINDIVEKEANWWNDFVVPAVMPMTIQAADNDTLYTLFPKENPDSTIELDADADQKIEALRAFKADAMNLKDRIETIEAELKALLTDKESGKSALYTITWKAQSRDTLDTKKLKEEKPEIYKKYAKTSESRVFRVKTNKGE